MDPLVENDLIAYVVNQETTPDGNKRIREFCEKQEKKSLILYRGHKNSKTIRENIWYSASSSETVARDEFAGENGYVFKIHLVNVPTIDINYYVGNKIGKYKEEKEYIFLGGGAFYKNKHLDTPGFVEKNNIIECWYSIPVAKTSPDETTKITQILKIIPEEEYDFIESPSDIIVDITIDKNTKTKVYEEIQKRKKKSSSKGGRKTRRSRVRTRKSRSRKPRPYTSKFK